ncbi:Asp-tRNA(Asn)/Glu-tRNA(Gln) amidotransferase subunit GatC [Paenibacillus thermotolerans]|uniref:Asp-tRNA(Asn)/Glu-tRNA(Gln) amidotransferase subunit GatC n=1 Tax=Paenibacillus thermotolerans TaxID=3027807 RepID=UPI0023689C69|nr:MULTISPECIES: Asp-tRNA(Asn)/Glu-tRNA(Gln) amidotransferase subunit GatC [unclassified Paenibacillus]
MSVTRKEVEHVAALARLRLSEEEKEQFTERLNAILQYAEKLNELNTEGVEPTSHVLPLRNVMRPDEARPSWPLADVLANAPEEEDGQFRVPAVLE